MLVKKIISGGQTGAEQAALDAAIKWHISHEGWVPKGRKNEYGNLSNKYHLKEMPSESYPKRTEQNVLDSHGTLILSHGELPVELTLTQELAKKQGRPCLHIDLQRINTFNAAKIVKDWLAEHGIETLNVTGPRASQDPKIYQATIKTLVTIFHLSLVETTMPDPYRVAPYLPRTVHEAVDRLISDMPLRDKSDIAKMKVDELGSLQHSLGKYIRYKYGLWSVNHELMASCRSFSGVSDLRAEEASGIIIKELWKKLRETHGLRRVK